MKTYQSFKEINRHLKQLSLERQIAYEELKIVKNDFEESLRPARMLSNALGVFGKFSTLLFIKKMFK
ncbi:DUF6327 family protein [Polaribacter sp.]|uniref:DUF6327 family protein n=1 Tax=Polaribacter sp. TaxID=1920175 RepID=UPI003EF0BACB